MNSSDDIAKAVNLPEGQDPNHEYIYRGGEFGNFYQYWYKDRAGNYIRYSNAPEDSKDHDKYLGEPIIEQDQPFLNLAPHFYTPEGWKRHTAPPLGVETAPNPDYSKADESKIWFEKYTQGGRERYIYLDSDVKENVDLYVQYWLRVTDANLTAFRKYASTLFNSPHLKDKMTGCLLILADQGMFTVDELCNAVVADIHFIDKTVKLLEKKTLPDEAIFDFLTSLVGDRDPSSPLFELDTLYGKQPISVRYLNAVFATIRVSPKFLRYWHSSHFYSRIINKLAAFAVSKDDVEGMAFQELAEVLNTADNVRCCVDYRLQQTLMENYAESTQKSLSRDTTDNYGVFRILSNLESRAGDELEFSTWLHNTPLHEVRDNTPEEPEALDQDDGATEGGEGEGVVEPEESEDEAVKPPEEATDEQP